MTKPALYKAWRLSTSLSVERSETLFGQLWLSGGLKKKTPLEAVDRHHFRAGWHSNVMEMTFNEREDGGTIIEAVLVFSIISQRHLFLFIPMGRKQVLGTPLLKGLFANQFLTLLQQEDPKASAESFPALLG